ncbi:MAG: hypothetical protein FJW30_00220 [Acidobacteria bacterium]|nr:hypothetical protein [Acidobacteriota bacterium]
MVRPGPVIAVLRAIWVAASREVKGYASITGQNFSLFLLLLFQQPESGYFLALLLAAVVLFPMATDPLAKAPPERRLLWPLAGAEWSLIRAAAWLASPFVWLGALGLYWSGWQGAAGMLGALAGVALLSRAGRAAGRVGGGALLRQIPRPPGAMGAIVRLHWRTTARTMDLYFALALAATAGAYGFLGPPLDANARPMLAAMVTLALSTQTQLMLSIDGAGADRYSLFPIRGWRVLLAKDLAFLALVLLLTLPLDAAAGAATGLAALVTGRYRSVTTWIPQKAWRFTSGVLMPDGVVQAIAIFAVGSATGGGALAGGGRGHGTLAGFGTGGRGDLGGNSPCGLT